MNKVLFNSLEKFNQQFKQCQDQGFLRKSFFDVKSGIMEETPETTLVLE